MKNNWNIECSSIIRNFIPIRLNCRNTLSNIWLLYISITSTPIFIDWCMFVLRNNYLAIVIINISPINKSKTRRAINTIITINSLLSISIRISTTTRVLFIMHIVKKQSQVL